MSRLFCWVQHVLPHHLLSGVIYRATRWRTGWWKNLLIAVIRRAYRVDMSDAVRQEANQYVHFNDFFTRELQDDARRIVADDDAIACPSDGAISAMGAINGDRIFQAKGREYTIEALLAGRADLAETFRDGQFCTVYLAPHNYHRIHTPLAGRLLETIYVPGRLFSVSTSTVANVDRLFARNERLITVWDTKAGPMILILVGAMLVSSMETVWHGEYAKRRDIETANLSAQNVALAKGQELGRFNMGSTVILLFGKSVSLEDLTPHTTVRMGQRIGGISES